MEKLINLFERLVLALEKLAGTVQVPTAPANTEPAAPAASDTPARGRGRPRKEAAAPAPAPAPAPEPEAESSEWPEEEAEEEASDKKFTATQIKDVLFAYNKLVGHAKTKELLIANTANKADAPSKVQESDYSTVHRVFTAAIKAATPKE